MNLKSFLSIYVELGGTPSSFFRSRMSNPNKGKGLKAKSRASALVWEMVRTGKFSQDFDRINRYSC